MNKALLALAMLIAATNARGLIPHAKIDFKAQTNTFGPSFDNGLGELGPSGVPGLILGFLAYGGFVIYCLAIFVYDNFQRHKMYDDMIDKQVTILRDEYKCSEAEI